MKKINLFLTILAAAAGFTNCTKTDLVVNKETGNGGTVVYATTDATTKTTLAADYKVLWSTNDKIKFVKDGATTTTYTYTLLSGEETTNGTFTCADTPEDGEYTVYYPASYDGTNWPAQTYAGETDISGALMKATATVSGGSVSDISFKNEGGILRYTVKGSKTIKSINVKSGSTLDVTLDCGTSGVELTTKGTVFNIALPAGTYSDATLTFTATDYTIAEKTASSFKVTKNMVSLATFEESDLSFDSSCIAAGTMITMGNGAQKVVEEIEIGEVIRTVDHETGTVSSAPVCFIWKTENASNAFTLTFEDGTDVTVIEDHGFYDQEERKYAFINADNAKDYFGHHFFNADNGQWLELKSCKMLNNRVDAYAIVTSKHLNHLSNGLLSMCDGSIKVLANIFEYDEQMRFDADKKAADIAAYGLTPLEKILEYKGFLEADYYDYNLQYLNIVIGKGLTTWDRVKAFSDYCEANGIY